MTSIGIDVGILEKLLGAKPDVFEDEGVAKVTFPRSDVKVRIEGRPMEPFMGLTSWVSFQKGKKPGIEAMLMGDLVLFEDEVNPAMSAALDHGLEVTALHNHFFFDRPNVYFMHVGGEGTLTGLAQAVQEVLKTVRGLRSRRKAPADRFVGRAVPSANKIDGTRIETLLGVKGTAKNGMFKVVIGRETTAACGCTVGKNMGVNTWAAFAGRAMNAFVDGDFAVLEEELRPVLCTLRASGINVVAIHNHMVLENPRFLFIHYWAKGRVEDLARALKGALDQTREHNPSKDSCCHH